MGFMTVSTTGSSPAQWLRAQQAKEIVREVSDMQICTSPSH
ncbi:hypothetical protein VCRA2119O147_190025 [Vibrio crassostreae]|uniref:Uncharacterized protein n=1 Tax=Vibrio crassostreae TaxID=246167 RepID=A0ABP1WSR7_9VIBR|nr:MULTISPECIES: hypothetical protein [Vibrio]MDP2590240.1 hypothetical protein [Vibrio splendidus]CAK1756340.1 hypothetical protein VCRA2119O47_140011 [Vibrio crassostreae]CAK1770865.1 hypothetical protein VCRA2119O44_140128 [Vibrio crassostreae]CAK1815557.1 hypothetical protein VCRA2110O113_170063 [Vibrio crassostreae]CAK1915139.1 hypothetical protein VCRA2119O245_230042 [Vibrio crassostreae]